MRTPRWTMFLAALVIGASLGACSASSSDDQADSTCRTALDYEGAGGASVNSPSTGVLTFTGQFYSNESVLLGYTDDAGAHHQMPLTPSSDRTQITFVGLPSGTRTYTVTISCDAGQDQRKNGNFVVK